MLPRLVVAVMVDALMLPCGSDVGLPRLSFEVDFLGVGDDLFCHLPRRLQTRVNASSAEHSMTDCTGAGVKRGLPTFCLTPHFNLRVDTALLLVSRPFSLRTSAVALHPWPDHAPHLWATSRAGQDLAVVIQAFELRRR